MLIRSNFNKLFTSTALPVLKQIIDDSYEQLEDFAPKIFNMLQMDRDIIQSLQVSGLPAAPENAEGAALEYQDVVQGYAKTYQANKYRLGVKITNEMIEDGDVLQMKRLAEELGKSMKETRIIQATTVFNNAFSSSYAGADGVALGSASHPLFAVGGTDSNTASADLSVTALRAGLLAMRETLNPQGLRRPVKARKLLVTTTDQWLAAELLKSVLKPGVSTQEVNTLPDLEIVVGDYLNDADSWFLIGDKHDLNFFQKNAMEIMSDEDFDGDALKIQARERFVVGFGDWRGVYCGLGT